MCWKGSKFQARSTEIGREERPDKKIEIRVSRLRTNRWIHTKAEPPLRFQYKSHFVLILVLSICLDWVKKGRVAELLLRESLDSMGFQQSSWLLQEPTVSNQKKI